MSCKDNKRQLLTEGAHADLYQLRFVKLHLKEAQESVSTVVKDWWFGLLVVTESTIMILKSNLRPFVPQLQLRPRQWSQTQQQLCNRMEVQSKSRPHLYWNALLEPSKSCAETNVCMSQWTEKMSESRVGIPLQTRVILRWFYKLMSKFFTHCFWIQKNQTDTVWWIHPVHTETIRTCWETSLFSGRRSLELLQPDFFLFIYLFIYLVFNRMTKAHWT